MANIKDKIAQIRQAIFGKEVRESIASGIEAINKEVENTTARQDNVEAQFQAVLDETTDKDVISAPEITAARVGADNTTHSNLKARLDAEHNEVMSQLAQKAEQSEVNRIEDKLDSELSAVDYKLSHKANIAYVDNKVDDLNNRIDNIITTPAESISAQEIIDARQGEDSLGANLTSIKDRVDEVKTSVLEIESKTSIIQDFAVGKNILNMDSAIVGYYVHSGNGKLYENPYSKVSQFIRVKELTTYTASSSSIQVAFYDERGEDGFISGIPLGTTATFTTPANTRYMRVSFSVNFFRLMIEEGDESTSYEPFMYKGKHLKLIEDNFTDDIVPIKSVIGLKGRLHQLEAGATHNLQDISLGENILNIDIMIEGYYVNSNDGKLYESEKSKVSPLLPIEELTQYTTYDTNRIVAFYDGEGEFISGIPLGGERTFTTPAGTRYYRISIGTVYHFYSVAKGSERTLEPYYYNRKNLRLKKENFEENSIPINAVIGLEERLQQIEVSPKKFRQPLNRVEPEIYLAGGVSTQIMDIDMNGDLYGIRWDNVVVRSSDGFKNDITTVLDIKPYLDSDEKAVGCGMLVSDTGRLIISTTKGKVFVSDEQQTQLSLAFQFLDGYTHHHWGREKKGRHILMCAYSVDKPNHPGREVYYSDNYGESFRRIFYMPTEEMVDPLNFHVHQAIYDEYSDMIMVVVGDNDNNQIYYSYDFGETWNKVNPDGRSIIHPTSAITFPEGIAFGSDDRPEGIWWWERPKDNVNPIITNDDFKPVATFNVGQPDLGNIGVIGSKVVHDGNIYGAIGFINHGTHVPGNPRLFVTGDGGRSWHEVFKDEPHVHGFRGVFLRVENGKVVIYGDYSYEAQSQIFRAEMPEFIDVWG